MTLGQICAPWVSVTINGLKALQLLALYSHRSSEFSKFIVGQCGNLVATKMSYSQPLPDRSVTRSPVSLHGVICSVLYNYFSKTMQEDRRANCACGQVFKRFKIQLKQLTVLLSFTVGHFYWCSCKLVVQCTQNTSITEQ